MSKRINIDGIFYRLRRGRWVPIPSDWLNKTTSHRTQRNRPSHLIGKIKRSSRHVHKNITYIDSKTTPIMDD